MSHYARAFFGLSLLHQFDALAEMVIEFKKAICE